MTRDPLVVAAAHHRGAQAEPLRFGEVLLHARPELLEICELVLACAATRGQRLLVERPSDELLEMAEWIEGRADRPDERGPLVAAGARDRARGRAPPRRAGTGVSVSTSRPSKSKRSPRIATLSVFLNGCARRRRGRDLHGCGRPGRRPRDHREGADGPAPGGVGPRSGARGGRGERRAIRARDDCRDQRAARAEGSPHRVRHDRRLRASAAPAPADPRASVPPVRGVARAARPARALARGARAHGPGRRARAARSRHAAGHRRRSGRGVPPPCVPRSVARAGGRRGATAQAAGRARRRLARGGARVPRVRACVDDCGRRLPRAGRGALSARAGRRRRSGGLARAARHAFFGRSRDARRSGRASGDDPRLRARRPVSSAPHGLQRWPASRMRSRSTWAERRRTCA